MIFFTACFWGAIGILLTSITVIKQRLGQGFEVKAYIVGAIACTAVDGITGAVFSTFLQVPVLLYPFASPALAMMVATPYAFSWRVPRLDRLAAWQKPSLLLFSILLVPASIHPFLATDLGAFLHLVGWSVFVGLILGTLARNEELRIWMAGVTYFIGACIAFTLWGCSMVEPARATIQAITLVLSATCVALAVPFSLIAFLGEVDIEHLRRREEMEETKKDLARKVELVEHFRRFGFDSRVDLGRMGPAAPAGGRTCPGCLAVVKEEGATTCPSCGMDLPAIHGEERREAGTGHAA